MKQVVRKGLRDIIVENIPEPVARPHHVLIQPVYSLISSGTETASIHQEAVVKEVAENPSHLKKIWDVMRITDPVRTSAEVLAKFNELAALGYSGAGILVDRHPTVTDLVIGSRVAYGGEGTGHAETIITGANLVVPVPDAVPFEHACFTTLGSIALHAVRTARVGVGETVVVIGLGLVGQLCSQLARLAGGVVIATDLVEKRSELARSLGAHHVVAGGASLPEAVSSLTNGRGADVVIVAAASRSAAPCTQALAVARDRGTIVVVGAVDLHFPWEEMYRKEITLLMSRAYGPGSYDERFEKKGEPYPVSYVRWTERDNMAEFLRHVANGDVRVGPLVTHEFPLEDAPKAYDTILDPASGSVAVLLRYPRTETGGKEPPAPRRTKVEVSTARPAELRVALIGASNIARWAHMPPVMKAPGTVLRAVCSTGGVRARSYANRYRATYCTTDYGEVLSDPEIDVVIITTRHEHHAAQTIAALKAGKHVFVEKPMALTEEECRAIVRAARESGKQLAVGFNRRFAPTYRSLKRFAAGRTGPAVVACRMCSPGMSGSFWGADPASGGAIVGEAVHFIDLLYWLLESEPIGVSASSLPSGSKDPVGENNIVSTFGFADGSIASLVYCTVGNKASQGERVEVYVSGGAAVAEDFKRFALKGSAVRSSGSFWPRKGYGDQMRSFLDGVRRGVIPEATVRDGVRATIAALRMLESARTNTPCSIDIESVLE